MKTMITTLLIVFSFTLFTTNSWSMEMSKAELLSKAHELSSKAMNLGKLAEGKLENPKLKELNQKILSNQGLTSGALEQIAGQFGVKAPTAEATDKDAMMEKLKGLTGKAFEKEYLDSEVGLHTQLLDLMKNKLIPAVNSPVTKTLLNSYTPKLSSILETAKSLNF